MTDVVPPGGGSYVIGIDAGTHSLRAALIDRNGTIVGFAQSDYSTKHPRPGWAVQEPESWWDALVAAVPEAIAAAGVQPETISAIAIGATSCTLVCLDALGTALGPAIMWMDVRAAEEAESIGVSGVGQLELSGGSSASPEWLPSKALWLKRYEPDLYARTDWLAEQVDYLTYRLTGERVAALNTAAIRAYFDCEGAGWPRALFAACGLEELVEKLPDRVLPMGAPIGPIAAPLASALGLASGTLVVTGGADAFVGQVGIGAVAPGALALITGSSHLMLLQSGSRAHAPGVFGSYPSAVIDGEYTLEGGQAATGSMVDWYRDLVAGPTSGGFFEAITAEARRLPPGSDGLLVIDHWQGNRTPYIDGSSRGAVLGLTLSHGRANIFRALLESVCYGTETTLRRLREHGHTIERVIACGGATASPFWLQMHADVLGLPVEVTQVKESVALGAGMLAAVGAGMYASIQEAAAEMVVVDAVIEPDPHATAEYQPFIEAYSAAYHQLAEVQHFLASSQRMK